MTTAVSRITPCPPGFTDHFYKEAHGVRIPLRVWKAPGKKEGKRPWLFWMHGGEPYNEDPGCACARQSGDDGVEWF